MPLESLLGDHESTTATDVWSYGVTLWELFSLGRTPYASMNSTQVISYLREGNRLDRPRYSDDRV
jgi:serine/threonine protein kinase